jgi:excisionase family DNA binding protein
MDSEPPNLLPDHLLPEPSERPTLTVDEARPFMTLSRGSFYRAVADGTVPSIRCGRKILIPTAPFRRLLGLDDAS